jgi:UDP:flavonoid glycosyltransferase YjiC (YdhE family)
MYSSPTAAMGGNQALSMGVPLVVAGDTEDKAFVASRVAWTGAGISLGTSRPTSHEVRSAVREVLRDQAYRDHARRLQSRFTVYNALDHITGYVESFLKGAKRLLSQQNPYRL